jgi:hypothetical protein
MFKYKRIKSSKGNQTVKAKPKLHQTAKASKTTDAACTTKILKVHSKSHTSKTLQQITSIKINNSIIAISPQRKWKEWLSNQLMHQSTKNKIFMGI